MRTSATTSGICSRSAVSRPRPPSSTRSRSSSTPTTSSRPTTSVSSARPRARSPPRSRPTSSSIKRKPGFPQSRFRLGRLYEQTNRPESAVHEYSAAFWIDPGLRDPKRNPLVVDCELIYLASLVNYRRDVAVASMVDSDVYFDTDRFRKLPTTRAISSKEAEGGDEEAPRAAGRRLAHRRDRRDAGRRARRGAASTRGRRPARPSRRRPCIPRRECGRTPLPGRPAPPAAAAPAPAGHAGPRAARVGRAGAGQPGDASGIGPGAAGDAAGRRAQLTSPESISRGARTASGTPDAGRPLAESRSLRIPARAPRSVTSRRLVARRARPEPLSSRSRAFDQERRRAAGIGRREELKVRRDPADAAQELGDAAVRARAGDRAAGPSGDDRDAGELELVAVGVEVDAGRGGERRREETLRHGREEIGRRRPSGPLRRRGAAARRAAARGRRAGRRGPSSGGRRRRRPRGRGGVR